MQRTPELVYGTSWRRHGERRQRAARIARLLRPAAHVLGGLVSTELAVPYRQQWYRPDVGVVLGSQVPLDGVLPRAPSLVVTLGGPLPPDAWLEAGARVVWARTDDGVYQLSRSERRLLHPDQWLEHPEELALRLPADHLAGEPSGRTRLRL
jgi:hypothetical protein